MEIKELFNGDIQTVVIENLKSAFNIMTALFGILGTFLTCIGMSLFKIFTSLPDFKNRKTVKYIICKRVLGKLNKDFWLKCLVPMVEIIWFLLTPCIMLVIIYIVLAFVNIIIICTSDGEKSILIVFILFIGIWTAGFLGKKLKQSKKIKVFFLFLYCLFSAIVYSVFYCSAQQLLTIIALISIGIEFYLIYFIYKWGANRYCKYTFGDIVSRWIRYAIILMTAFSLIKGNVNYITMLYWLYVCWVLFKCMVNTDESIYTDIIIHTVDGNKETKRRIMQYENNRVKYDLKDGTTEIVEEEDILFFSYQLSRLPKIKFLQGFRKNTKIECILKDAELNKILSCKIKSYHFVGESWIGFKVEQSDKYEKIIININRVKKITEHKIT